jgi:hypothetical protein
MDLFLFRKKTQTVKNGVRAGFYGGTLAACRNCRFPFLSV